MRDATSLSYQDLDLKPRRDAVSSTLARAWPVAVPPRPLLLRYGNELVVTDRRSIGLLRDGSWTPLDIELKDFSASASGDIALTDAKGAAYLWRPPQAPVLVWRAPADGAHLVVSLGGGRLLILRFAGEDLREAFAVEAEHRSVLWRIDPDFHFAAAVRDGILAWTKDTSALQCFDPASGSRRWRTDWPGSMGLIGIVDGILWGPGRSQLFRLNCETGEMLAPIAIENAHLPKGVLDQSGIFHCCHGLNYQTYDLRDGGRRLSYAEFRITGEGPTLGAGNGGMIVTTDGRLIFRDQRHGLWMVHPDRPEHPDLIARLNGPLGELAARDGQVLVAEDSGAVTAFG
jgi:hypothetical protein